MTDEELINKVKDHIEKLDILIIEAKSRRIYIEFSYSLNDAIEQAFSSNKKYKIKLSITKNY